MQSTQDRSALLKILHANNEIIRQARLSRFRPRFWRTTHPVAKAQNPFS